MLGFFNSVTESEPLDPSLDVDSSKHSPYKQKGLQSKNLNLINERLLSMIEPPMKRQVLLSEIPLGQVEDSSYHDTQDLAPSQRPLVETAELTVLTSSLKEEVLPVATDDQLDRIRATSITSGSTDGDSHSLSHLLQLHTLQSDTMQQSSITEEGLCLDDL